MNNYLLITLFILGTPGYKNILLNILLVSPTFFFLSFLGLSLLYFLLPFPPPSFIYLESYVK